MLKWSLHKHEIQNKCVFSRSLKLVKLSNVLIAVGKLFHRDTAATANEPSPALVRVRFILTCYCSQCAVFLSVDTGRPTRVHVTLKQNYLLIHSSCFVQCDDHCI